MVFPGSLTLGFSCQHGVNIKLRPRVLRWHWIMGQRQSTHTMGPMQFYIRNPIFTAKRMMDTYIISLSKPKFDNLPIVYLHVL